MNRCLQISARVDTRPRIFPTVRTIKRILADARRFPVLWPKVGLKRAKVFYSYTYERTARVHLATIMDVLKTSLASQRNSKKEMKKVFGLHYVFKKMRLPFLSTEDLSLLDMFYVLLKHSFGIIPGR